MNSEDYTDSTIVLLQRARQGDQEALERLFKRHLKPLQRWASGRLPKGARDLVDTDDLVEDTLLQTFKRVGDFEPRGVGAFQAYLRQAVRNRLLDELRRKGRRPEAASLDGLEPADTPSPLEEAIGGLAQSVASGSTLGKEQISLDGLLVSAIPEFGIRKKVRSGADSSC